MGYGYTVVVEAPPGKNTSVTTIAAPAITMTKIMTTVTHVAIPLLTFVTGKMLLIVRSNALNIARAFASSFLILFVKKSGASCFISFSKI